VGAPDGAPTGSRFPSTPAPVTNVPQHNWRSLVTVLALSLGAAGCAMTFDASSLGVSASMASPATQPAAGDTFDIHAKAVYLFWGLFSSQQPSLLHVLEGQAAGARAIQDLRVHVSRRWSDVLITCLTLGVISPESVEFRGVIVAGPP